MTFFSLSLAALVGGAAATVAATAAAFLQGFKRTLTAARRRSPTMDRRSARTRRAEPSVSLGGAFANAARSHLRLTEVGVVPIARPGPAKRMARANGPNCPFFRSSFLVLVSVSLSTPWYTTLMFVKPPPRFLKNS